MFGAIPGTASPSSLKRRGAGSSASTSSRLQRSPTRSSAVPSALGPGGRGRRRGRSSRLHGRGGLAARRSAVVDCKSQVTLAPTRRHQQRGYRSHVRAHRAPGGRRRRRGRRRPVRRRDRLPAPRLRRRHRRRPRPDQRPQPPRRRGHRPLRRTAAPTRGTVAGVDWDGDLAVVEVDTAGAPAIAWSAGGATIGSAVFAAAATPSGGARVSFGFVSSVERAFRGPGGRRISGSLEHTAPLAPGSSGSALLDADGALVGLNTNRVGEGFYLALPADAVAEGAGRRAGPRRVDASDRAWASRLRRRTSRGACGGRSGCPERDGVLVRGVEDGSARPRPRGSPRATCWWRPAARRSTTSTPSTSCCATPGFPLEVTLVRGTEERTVTVAPAAADGAEAVARSNARPAAGASVGRSPRC